MYQPLGMLVGYHLIETQEDQITVPQFQDGDLSENGTTDGAGKLNTGFGVVIPIERVIEILESNEEQERIKRGLEARAKLSSYIPAVVEAINAARRRKENQV